ncbi:hypothetical protein SAMN00768000_3096 [Sulfobacillus thermosulfidooxidans DSM 9293]|uniref:Uncharacterized protein n=1 Tax=Sulfobacillus thermosulfidooxidans (strain DSM 9293 / VKM B-1269 / AT-1) TaxID=929705 RepID=A0A1W1WKP9_SULTA|nr:hypothetical protein [Sulfobacillus thermosulfidooxidans]SMC06908.1 hypothetical protein SAMN00768000_3096 [Sulfobacillus thermosulfidooxidans DSM 9293]
MKTSSLVSFRRLNYLEQVRLIQKAWSSDGADGIEGLGLLLGISPHNLAAMAGLTANYARAVNRRLVREKRRRRQPIPKGFRSELRKLAHREARGW